MGLPAGTELPVPPAGTPVPAPMRALFRQYNQPDCAVFPCPTPQPPVPSTALDHAMTDMADAARVLIYITAIVTVVFAVAAPGVPMLGRGVIPRHLKRVAEQALVLVKNMFKAEVEIDVLPGAVGGSTAAASEEESRREGAVEGGPAPAQDAGVTQHVVPAVKFGAGDAI